MKTIFHHSINNFPAVLVTGPRQAGKSTFLQHELPDTPYITFDDPLNRDFALNDANGFLDQFTGKPVILDEIQYVPELLNYIKMRIDKNRSPGIWTLTGSQQFHLMKGITETLAGRIAILELPPFSINEGQNRSRTLEDIVWTGLFPEPTCFPARSGLWIKSYVQTYLERDVRQMENIHNFRAFEMFVNLCAAYHAQEFKPARLAGNCGVSQPTVKSWSKILEASYIAIMLPPLYKNYGKRIIKTPKFYFSDPSLVCYLTRQPSPEAAIRGNMAGFLFEGLVISDVWKTFLNQGQTPAAFFWRSQGGLEVDLIIQAQGKYWPVEIKLTSTPDIGHVKGLNRFKLIAGDESSLLGVLVCCIDNKKNLPGNNIALPWNDFSTWLKEII